MPQVVCCNEIARKQMVSVTTGDMLLAATGKNVVSGSTEQCITELHACLQVQG
jgi:hypothetical protein